jgi:hypothetical protein
LDSKNELFYFKLNDSFNKVRFIERIKELDSSCFSNFNPLFEKIKEIKNEIYSE